MGNKRQFEEKEVLSQVATHFWEHGYSATKVDQLSELTGLTKTSLYNAFGNKEALFISALNFYVDNSLSELLLSLDTKKSLTENIEKIFKHSFTSCKNKNLSYGCLLTNSILEFNGSEPILHHQVTQLFDKVRTAMYNFFSVYVKDGRVALGYTSDDLADLYMTFFQGLRVQSRGEFSEQVLSRSIKSFLTLIKSIETNKHS